MGTVTREDLAVIYNPLKGRYRFVTHQTDFKKRTKPWMAFVNKNKFLGVFSSEREAACKVVSWFKEQYGWKWVEVVSRRIKKINPTHTRRYPTSRGVVWLLYVWVCGVKVKVGSYSTKAEARLARRRWSTLLENRCDLEGRLALLGV